MSFVRRPEMSAWFSNLLRDKSLEIQFDAYYLCLMIGYASLRDDAFDGGEELIRHFPDRYSGAQSKLIIGLLLIAETQKFGLMLSKKQDVEYLVTQYLDPVGGALNPEGFERMNRYANGGFNYLAESFDKPYYFDAFLASYNNELAKLTANSDLWAGQHQIII